VCELSRDFSLITWVDKHVGEVENATCLELSREHIQQLKRGWTVRLRHLQRVMRIIRFFSAGCSTFSPCVTGWKACSVILTLNMNTCGFMPHGN
jgi:hypothetical protein